MNNHSGNEHSYHPPVLPKKIRNDGIGPSAADLIHHILRGRPCYFVRGSRIEVAAGAEEQTRERNESERLEYRPSSTQGLRNL